MMQNTSRNGPSDETFQLIQTECVTLSVSVENISFITMMQAERKLRGVLSFNCLIFPYLYLKLYDGKVKVFLTI